MAVVTFPDVPATNGPLKLRRPAVYLCASGDSTPGWLVQHARELGRHIPTVFLPAAPRSAAERKFLTQWAMLWMSAADVVGLWIEGAHWPQFELGLALGRGDTLIVGLPEKCERERETVAGIFQALGTYDIPIYLNDDDWITAIEATARGL